MDDSPGRKVLAVASGEVDARAAFARRRRQGFLLIAGGLVGGGSLAWIGRQHDMWILILVGLVVMVPAILKGAADLNTCPHCGEGTEIPEDASGSWNHCYSCRARIR
jgi:hypothetical protein